MNTHTHRFGLFLPALALGAGLLIALTGSTGHAADEQSVARSTTTELRIPFPETTVHRVEVHPQNKNLLLVARDRGQQGEGVVTGAHWCGPRLLMFAYGYSGGYGKVLPFHGGFLFDVVSRKMWRIGKFDGSDGTLNCTPDGEWLLYSKKENQGKNLVLWRYHIRTGKKEPFLQLDAKITQASSQWGAWSPDSKKMLYFRKRMGDHIKTGDPQWEAFWLGWEPPPALQGTAVWLADSASILVNGSEIRRVAGNQRKQLNTDLKLSMLQVDAANRIYGINYQTLPHIPGTHQKSKLSLFRCEITLSDSLKCDEAITGNLDIAPGFQVSPNGDAIFFDDPTDAPGKRCIWRYDVRSQQRQCLWEWKAFAGFLSLSPDAKLLAFMSDGLFVPDAYGQTNGFAVMRFDNN